LLIDQGAAKCSIVIRPAAPKAENKRDFSDERAAAEDFARIAKKMTGADVSIGTEPQDGLIPIYIGESGLTVAPDAKNKLKHPDPLALKNDRFLIEIRRDRVVLLGARAWGTRMAVTQFFENAGCRWFGGGDFFEVIPESETLAPKTVRKIYTPDFEMRDVWYVKDEDLAHLKLQRHDVVLHHGHSWQIWIGKERKERPELRGLVQGDRKGPLEYAHPDVPDIFVKNINAFFDRTGNRTASLSTDDGPVYSESKESSAWLLKEYANPFMATPAISDAVLRLFNKVIPKVQEKHPGTAFGFLVYANTMTPPRYETVHPSIAVVGAPLAENAMVPTTSETDDRRIHFRKCFSTWMKLARRGYIYEYDPFVIWHGVMCPRVELIRRNVPYYKSIGVRGMNIESRKSQFAESGLNILVYSRLFWDTGADVDDILDDFASTFYGPARKAIRRWIKVTQESVLNPSAPIFGNEDHNIELIYTAKTMAAAEKAIRKAESVAKVEPWKKRVHVVRLIHNHTEAYLESKNAMDRCQFADALSAIDRMYEIKAKLAAIDPMLTDPNRWDLKSEGPPWLRGLRKQTEHWASLAGQKGDGSEGTLIQILPEKWNFVFDPDNLGLTNSWAQKGELERASPIDIGQPWDYQGHLKPRIANGWYQTRFNVPLAFKGKPIRLYFTRIYGMKITLWIGGKLVEHRDLPRWFWYDYHHEREFDVTNFVKPGETQTITMRVFKEFDWGGPYGGAFLYSPKDAARQIKEK